MAFAIPYRYVPSIVFSLNMKKLKLDLIISFSLLTKAFFSRLYFLELFSSTAE